MSHAEKTGKNVATGHVGPEAITRACERTPAEIAVIEEQAERIAETLAAPKVKKTTQKENVLTIEAAPEDHELWKALMARAVGTADDELSNWALTKLLNAIGDGHLTAEDINATLAIMHGLRPRDELEGMLIAQMVAVHCAAMMAARHFHNTKTIEQKNCQSNALNKLMRTFATQMEALNRYRGKGQQKVTVEHVHVHEGGQAIVGNVEGGGGRGIGKGEGQPHATGATVRGNDEGRNIVPLARDD